MLRGECDISEIMGCSAVQGLVVAVLLEFLYKNANPKTYRIFTNEWGLKGINLLRIADIAIYERQELKGYVFNDKYMTIAPKIVIEVDLKADTDDFDTPINYFYEKAQELLGFGVETVFWVTTKSKKVMIATQGNAWITHDWSHELEFLPNCTASIAKLLADEEL